MAETSAVKSPAGECATTMRTRGGLGVSEVYVGEGNWGSCVYVCMLKCNQRHGGNYYRHLCKG